MPVAQIQFDVPELLRRAGATLRGRNRADCPRCGKRRTVSYVTDVFHCHHTECNFRGNTITLARELGLLKRLPAKEAQELKAERERARTAAQWAIGRVKQRRLKVCQIHQDLLDIKYGAMDRLENNRQDEIGWACLAYAYKEIPVIRAELTLLEEAPPLERLMFLDSSDTQRDRKIDSVVLAGGVTTPDGKFVEVQTN